MRWTDAPRGHVLEAFSRHIGHPVTVKNYSVRVEAPREEMRRPSDYRPDLAALADLIVSGD